MSDLGEFLLARIAEDEAWARAAAASPDRPWVSAKSVDTSTCRLLGTWDPARVLAECEAKRRIVEADSRRWTLRKDAPNGLGYGSDPSGRIRVRLGDSEEIILLSVFNERYCEPAAPSDHVRLLALPYAEHPDFREEWRP